MTVDEDLPADSDPHDRQHEGEPGDEQSPNPTPTAFSGDPDHLRRIQAVRDADRAERAHVLGEWNDWMSMMFDPVDLRGADLGGGDLSKMNFRCVDLSGADCSHSSLKGANLRSAVLNGARCVGCDLSDATLLYADIRNADLSDCRLSQEQVDGCFANEHTILPAGLRLPESKDYHEGSDRPARPRKSGNTKSRRGSKPPPSKTNAAAPAATSGENAPQRPVPSTSESGENKPKRRRRRGGRKRRRRRGGEDGDSASGSDQGKD